LIVVAVAVVVVVVVVVVVCVSVLLKMHTMLLQWFIDIGTRVLM